MKKLFSLTLVLTLVISIFSTFHASAVIPHITKVPSGYTPIRTFEDLYSIRNNLNGKYILMNDIDMSDETKPGGDWDIDGNGWEPIGDKDNPFNGDFNGNGYSISGMNIHGTVTDKYIGLFGYVGYKQGFQEDFQPMIANLKVENVNIDITIGGNDKDYFVGAIIGKCYDNDAIYSNNFTSGSIEVDASAAQHYDVDIGGHIGDFSESGIGTISDCYSIADINVTSGYKNAFQQNRVGGIVGEGRYMNRCYFAGSISADGDGNILEPINADIWYESDFNSCYYLIGSCPDRDSTGGCREITVGQMKSTATFTGWDFKNTWVIDPTGSYKYPQLRVAMHIPVTKITLKSPIKSSVYQGSSIDLGGAYIHVDHVDGSAGDLAVSSGMLRGYKSSTLGKQTVKIYYLGATTSFAVTVKAKKSTLKTFKLSTTSYTYNGKKKTPTVTVKDSNGKKLVKNRDYKVTYQSGRKKVGKYKVTIKGIGNYIGSKNLYFTIKPRKTKFTSIKCNRHHSGKINTTLKWKFTGAEYDAYEIEYSTSKKFKKSKTVRIPTVNTTATDINKSCQILGLKRNKTYYCRIRTLYMLDGKMGIKSVKETTTGFTVKYSFKGKKIYSDWSKVKSKKIK